MKNNILCSVAALEIFAVINIPVKPSFEQLTIESDGSVEPYLFPGLKLRTGRAFVLSPDIPRSRSKLRAANWLR